MPRKPCCARVPASEARTFAPNSGAKVTAFLQAVGQVPGHLCEPEARLPAGRWSDVSRKTCAESNPPEIGRGSSRGRQPASNGIKCPGSLAVQGFRQAKRGLLRRTAAQK